MSTLFSIILLTLSTLKKNLCPNIKELAKFLISYPCLLRYRSLADTRSVDCHLHGRLWEPQGGEFVLPMETGDPLTNLKKLFVVPQKIHMALG